MTRSTMTRLAATTAIYGLLAACAGNTTVPEKQSSMPCPTGQVQICKGGEVNSRIDDSKRNSTEVCICRQSDTY